MSEMKYETIWLRTNHSINKVEKNRTSVDVTPYKVTLPVNVTLADVEKRLKQAALLLTRCLYGVTDESTMQTKEEHDCMYRLYVMYGYNEETLLKYIEMTTDWSLHKIKEDKQIIDLYL